MRLLSFFLDLVLKKHLKWWRLLTHYFNQLPSVVLLTILFHSQNGNSYPISAKPKTLCFMVHKILKLNWLNQDRLMIKKHSVINWQFMPLRMASGFYILLFLTAENIQKWHSSIHVYKPEYPSTNLVNRCISFRSPNLFSLKNRGAQVPSTFCHGNLLYKNLLSKRKGLKSFFHTGLVPSQRSQLRNYLWTQMTFLFSTIFTDIIMRNWSSWHRLIQMVFRG